MRAIPLSVTLSILSAVPQVCGAQRVVAVDIKTRFADKVELSAIKAGVIAHIGAADWITVKEVGEDYSVWLGAFKRIRDGDVVTVLLSVDLRTPAAVRSGRELESRSIKVTFRTTDEWLGEQSVRDGVDRALRNRAGERRALTIEALVVGERVLQTLREMIGRQ